MEKNTTVVVEEVRGLTLLKLHCEKGVHSSAIQLYVKKTCIAPSVNLGHQRWLELLVSLLKAYDDSMHRTI